MLTVAMIFSPGYQVMNLAALTVFEVANMNAEQAVYDIHLLSEHGGLVRSSMGTPLETQPLSDLPFDTIIFGGPTRVTPASAALRAFARKSLKSSRRVAAICMGAFTLAEAGVLAGRSATTHWLAADELRERFPTIKVEEDRIFIVDGPVWTSAGMSAGIDLALEMVEGDIGAEMALSVAQVMVVYHRRAGGQTQHSALLAMKTKSDRIQDALAYAQRHLAMPLSVEELAASVHLSPRHFSRAFRAETGVSPAKAIETLRLEAARVMVEQSRHPIGDIASNTGFGDQERMRRAFIRAFGHSPQALRRAARSDGVE
jgi:transcriptional regulator GlxA family with amidase domain